MRMLMTILFTWENFQKKLAGEIWTRKGERSTTIWKQKEDLELLYVLIRSHHLITSFLLKQDAVLKLAGWAESREDTGIFAVCSYCWLNSHVYFCFYSGYREIFFELDESCLHPYSFFIYLPFFSFMLHSKFSRSSFGISWKILDAEVSSIFVIITTWHQKESRV